MTEPIHIISLGAGVQSSTMALMASRGELPDSDKVVAAIFADTGDEPQEVYDFLNYLEPMLSFPVYRVSMEMSLSKHIEESIREKRRVSKPPLFTESETSDGGILTRDCTGDFKVRPIQRKVRELLKEHGVKRAIQWIGISLDEVQRMKPSRVKYSTHRWPLIDARMSRHDCLMWMDKNGYKKPPRSACVFCPFKSNAEWKRLRDENPEDWNKAVEFDKMIRVGLNKVRNKCYVHKSRVPLDEADLSDDFDRGQGNLFGNECEGMCGV